MRKLQKLRRSKSKDEKKAAKRAIEIENQCNAYLDICQQNIARVRDLKCFILENSLEEAEEFSEIDRFVNHADCFMDQIRRRIIQGESIPHEEKVFSVFEEHTEWISKGKAGVPVELGLRVAIVEDQFGFILHHKVLQQDTDDKIAVPIIQETQERFPGLEGCSFDKGFYSPENQEELSNLLNLVVLPKKGKLSKKQREVEQSNDFRLKRQKHSAVESGINALEIHGLDRCPDNGLDHFKLYTAIAVTARNLQKIGALVQKSKRKAEARLKKAG
jgi:IS5 family transposase|tara:strand:+ start:847 stop:1668 length:822 start_codon:yes stop_codon:yes gene_type:complete